MKATNTEEASIAPSELLCPTHSGCNSLVIPDIEPAGVETSEFLIDRRGVGMRIAGEYIVVVAAVGRERKAVIRTRCILVLKDRGRRFHRVDVAQCVEK